MRFDPSLSLDAALEQYFCHNGFAPDAPERFVPVKLGVLTLPFPNPPGRRQVIRLHDLHHIATGYETRFTGECEIAAFELAAGCGTSAIAWLYNLPGFGAGLILSPRRTLRAFARGRRARSLYLHPELKDAPTVGELRARLGITDEARLRLRDLPSFAGMVALAVLHLPVSPLAFAVFAIQALRRADVPEAAPGLS